MNRILLLIPFFVFGIGTAYAEPLEYVQALVLDHEDNYATVQLDWNRDGTVKKYEIGCVSCIPNVVEFSTEDIFTMKNVTAFPNSSNAMLYIIAYDSNDEIINAKQILVNIKK
ncbi:MAG TPA: hypothetical protein VIH04_06175 [Nitrosarchaeum sp.]